ncbi:hypothetical protein QYF36_003201 [Acer negundo]|nr:hypothetical protein QYF36_003201 [Acer negundo]
MVVDSCNGGSCGVLPNVSGKETYVGMDSMATKKDDLNGKVDQEFVDGVNPFGVSAAAKVDELTVISVANFLVKVVVLVAIQKGLQIGIDCGLTPDVIKISISANKAAIGLVKHPLNIMDDVLWMEEFPGCIGSVIEAEKPG